jgi:small redox-active disulfide protein 2
MEFQVLGMGCAKCSKTIEVIERIGAELGQPVSVSKVTDPATIMRLGVMTTPAVVRDGKVLHSGSIPSRAQVESWLAS